MLEKYLNLEGFLEKSLKIKYASKSTGKLSKVVVVVDPLSIITLLMNSWCFSS